MLSPRSIRMLGAQHWPKGEPLGRTIKCCWYHQEPASVQCAHFCGPVLTILFLPATLMVAIALNCPEQPQQNPLPAALPKGCYSAWCWTLTLCLGPSYLVCAPVSSPASSTISQVTPWTHAATLLPPLPHTPFLGKPQQFSHWDSAGCRIWPQITLPAPITLCAAGQHPADWSSFPLTCQPVPSPLLTCSFWGSAQASPTSSSGTPLLMVQKELFSCARYTLIFTITSWTYCMCTSHARHDFQVQVHFCYF